MPVTASERFPAVRLLNGVGWVCVRTHSLGAAPDGRDFAIAAAAPEDALYFNVASLPDEVAVVSHRGELADEAILRFLSEHYADAVWVAAEAAGAAVIQMLPETRSSFATAAVAVVKALGGWDESKPIAVSSFRTGIYLVRLELGESASWRAEVRSTTCPWNELLATFPGLSARRGEPTVVAFDWDRALVFNDAYGHLQGDVVLARIAQTIAKHAAAEGIDFVRVAGDEFVAVFPPTLAERAEAWATEVTAAVRALTIPFRHPELGDFGVVTVTAFTRSSSKSGGVCTVTV